MIVIDASLMVEMLLNRPLGAVVRERLAHCAEPIAIPHIIDIEAELYTSDRRLARGHRARVRIFG